MELKFINKEIISVLLFSNSSGSGENDIANFSYKHKRHRFDMFEEGAACRSISHFRLILSLDVLLMFPQVGWLCGAFWIFLVSKRLLMVTIPVCFKFPFLKDQDRPFLNCSLLTKHICMFSVLHLPLRRHFNLSQQLRLSCILPFFFCCT